MLIINKLRLTSLPDAVLFDTDNTLYPYNPAHFSAQKAVKEKVVSTLAVTEEDFESAYSEARQQVKQRLKQTASSHSRLLYMQRMLENMGLGSQILLALDFEQTYWRTFLSNAILFDGVKDLLEDIRVMGIGTAIVTDLTAQIQFRKMVYFELDHYFDYMVSSEEAGFDKPHHAPFQIAIEKLRPSGDLVWMIGDNVTNDIAGAKKHINAVTLLKVGNINKISKNDFSDDQMPDVIFDNYRDISNLVRMISDSTK